MARRRASSVMTSKRVQNPRLMTDDYFENVVEIYDELAEKGPQP